MLKALELFAAQQKTEIEELKERSRLAQIQKENGSLKSEKEALHDIRNYVEGLK